MKKVWNYTCITFGLITVFVLGNYFCYQSAMKHFNQMQEDYEIRLSEQVHVNVTQEMEKQIEQLEEEKQESLEVDSTQNTLQSESIYQIQSFDCVTETTSTEYENLPDEMVGYSREEAQEFCSEYMENLSVEEYLDGLQSMDVIAFSGERLTVRKIYDASKVSFRYYLIANRGEVVVYYGDKKTVYEETGIKCSTLSDADRKKLKNGIEVTDEQELFSILENYSS